MVGSEEEVTVQDLHTAYKQFCEDNELRPLGKIKFGKAMEGKGYTKARGNDNVLKWSGIGVKQSEQTPQYVAGMPLDQVLILTGARMMWRHRITLLLLVGYS